ncbi:problable inactive peptidyl-prolyl cis-trans isomerase-like 6 [Agrilus planipennis]|uniref:Problable inactive peptidyl-prolyl cis-trans isomerase-like 6 n=1 Tax=Agrilus planipennis TaxID=224129 RepID=A0A1W4W8I3_AGRPL|nr:problable inactive peptidyl-prolyl cis-trans isomerase-like 6 [Agrilus planipennis]
MCDKEEEPPGEIQFRVIGIVTSKDFQKCRAYAERLHRNIPKLYDKPDIRPILDVEWGEFKNKVRRTVGGRSWETDKEVAVFVNDNYIGDYDDFIAHISQTYSFRIFEDWTKLGHEQLIEIIEQNQSNNGVYVYMTIAANNRVIGPLLFLLYSNIVPRTTNNFIKLCRRKKGGFLGAPIHRVVKGSWIQGGGYSIPKRKIPSENFIVPHDKRGVLSMANSGWHKNNSTQFIISLEATPWMDCKYVAFGQLVQGEEVLKIIEGVRTHHEAPVDNLRIVAAGEFTLYPRVDEEAMIELNKYIETREMISMVHEDVIHPGDVESSMIVCSKFLKHCYALKTDLRSYLPFIHLPSYLLFKFLYERILVREEEEEEEEGVSEGYDELRRLWMQPSFLTFATTTSVDILKYITEATATEGEFYQFNADTQQTITETQIEQKPEEPLEKPEVETEKPEDQVEQPEGQEENQEGETEKPVEPAEGQPE